MRFFRQDLHTLTGAYALDALDPGRELTRFNRHLDRCQSCAGEVRGFREVATAMAIAATTEPPPEMRDQVMAAVARTRQLSPEIRTHARPRRTRGTTPWIPWLSGAIATAAIAVAVFFGFAQAHTRSELNQARAQNQALAAAQGGVTTPVVATGITKGDKLGLTVEPAGGSKQPTTVPILALPLPV